MGANASTIRAGRAVVEIGGKDEGLKTTLNRAATRLRSFAKGASKWGAGIGAAGASIVAPLAAAVLGVPSLKDLFSQGLTGFEERGSALTDMAARTGMTTEALSELGYAAGQTGGDMESVEKGVRKMQQTVADAANGAKPAAEALAKLGLSGAQLSAMTPDEQLAALADRIDNIRDPAQRTAAALDVFGKGGTALLPMMAGGAAGLAAMRAEAVRLGVSMSSVNAAKADALGDAMARVKAAVTGVTDRVGAALAPALTWVADRITGVITSVSAWIERNEGLIQTVATVGAIIAGVGAAITGIASLALGASFVFSGLSIAVGVASSVLGVLGGVLGVVFSPVGIAVAAIAGAVAAFFLFTDAGQQLWTSIQDTLGKAWDWCTDVFGGIASAIGAGEWGLAAEIAWTAVQSVCASALAAIATEIADWGGILLGLLGETWDALAEAGQGVWGWLTTAADACWSGIVAGAQWLGAALGGVWTAISETGRGVWIWIKQAAAGAWNGVAAGGQWLADSLGSVWTSITAAAGTAWQWIADTCGRFVQWISDVWTNQSAIWGETFAGIGEALMNGDLESACQIAIDGVSAIWNQGIADLMTSWGDWIKAIVETFAGAMQQIAKLWVSTQGGISKGILSLAEHEGAVGDLMAKMLGRDIRKIGKDTAVKAAALDPARRTQLQADVTEYQGLRQQIAGGNEASATAAADARGIRLEGTAEEKLARLDEMIGQRQTELGARPGQQSAGDLARGAVDQQTAASTTAIDSAVGSMLNKFNDYTAGAKDRADAARQRIADKTGELKTDREGGQTLAELLKEGLASLLDKAKLLGGEDKPAFKRPKTRDMEDGLANASKLPELATQNSYAVQALFAGMTKPAGPEVETAANTRRMLQQLIEMNSTVKGRRAVAFA
jgi:hypothetical protein